MPCEVCGAPLMAYPDTGETVCSDDPCHDVDGSVLADDEYPANDPDNPATFDPTTMPWTVTSDNEADWACRKVQRARHELRRIDLMYREELRLLTERVEKLQRGPLRDEEFFTGHLRRYYEQIAAEGGLYGKAKQYPLVNGTLSSRAGSERVDIVDEAAVLDFAEGNARVDLLNIKTTPNKPALKKALKAGEEIPGVRLVVGEPSFSVEVSSDEAPAWLPLPHEAA